MTMGDKKAANNEGWVRQAFLLITARPGLMTFLGTVCVIAMLVGLKDMVKDTSVDALIPPDHESVEANQASREQFGIADPIIIAITADSIFRSDVLTLIFTLHQEIESLPNVRPDRVLSLATESSIEGHEDSIEVERYLNQLPVTDLDLQQIRDRWQRMAPHHGTLVSDDERGAIIAVELIDDRRARETYAEIVALLEQVAIDDVDIHVSGMAAVSGFLSSSIDQDSRLMQPIIFVVVLCIVFVAFRSALATFLPVVVIVASAGGALGIMAWLGVPYFTITSALPVILVAVSVADAIHILTGYYVRRGHATEVEQRSLVVDTMADMAPPITVTTLTTMAGFLGIALADIMPPVRYFAYFAIIGVGLAWMFSVLVLPNLILIARPKPSKALKHFSLNSPDRLATMFTRIGLFSVRNTGLCSLLLAALVSLAILGASQLKIDRALVEGFKPGASIRIADELINEKFAGTSFLDVVISTNEPEGLLNASRMKAIVDLQEFMETLPHVEKTVAITDYISLLHRAVNTLPDTESGRPLPDSDNAIAQYLLVYEASGDPADFEEEIDSAYQTALLRGYMTSRRYSDEKATVEALQNYVDRNFSSEEFSATLSGRVNVRYHWLKRLSETHFTGVGLSLTFVLLLAVVLFRSVSTGLIALVPVMTTILVLYAVMGTTGIYLEPATTMFAAISLGVGVDFSIHLVERFEKAIRQEGTIEGAVRVAMPETSRACFFNALALGLGFSVLLFSELLTLKRFGGLVAVAASASFVSALLIIPTLMAIREKLRASKTALYKIPSPSTALLILAAISAISAMQSTSALAAISEPTGIQIAKKIEQRNDGKNVIRSIEMAITDRRGHVRKRDALVLQKRSDDERKTLIVYLGPKSVRETAFLSYEYEDLEKSDDQWLYLPAMRKVRRIPSSDRGDYFLGTDFTYDDMQSELKFDLNDYNFNYLGQQQGTAYHVLQGVPKTPEIAKLLGYGNFEAHIDPDSWLPVQIDFKDLDQKPLKRVKVLQKKKFDEIWTPMEIEVVNHQTNHSTNFKYSNVRFPTELPERALQPSALSRGIPNL